ncbi:hypothetical protein KTO58_03330 [Chitinophaga pendula]|uniref:hypothetical protein n=1 Tax=Chitinophaga TaxID=79328 RepID=UPI0012FE6E25|nr:MULTISPECIES: hypothetical protein [Chitinophaga]UCJ08232.1 hypothetical protein KTO58_03330 [Chitinophaga pendula]
MNKLKKLGATLSREQMTRVTGGGTQMNALLPPCLVGGGCANRTFCCINGACRPCIIDPL